MRTTKTRFRLAWRGPMASALAVLVLGCGCAYFNTFFNAKSQFRKGEEERLKQVGSLGTESYQRCIDKCQLLMRYYPKSKYVDDALFLIGLSRLYRAEYVQSRAAFEELVQRFPKSEYVERGWYHMGLAALRQGDAAGAGQALSTLAAEFPDSKLNIEAVFRRAEAQLDTHDYEQARTELRAFIRDHPQSPFAADAQLRVARTYYDEERYEEAREEYARLLDQRVTADVRYEAQLAMALSQRALAEEVLANPVLQRASRMHHAKIRSEPAPKPGDEDERRPQPHGQPGSPRPPTPPPAGAPWPAGVPPPGADLQPPGAAEPDTELDGEWDLSNPEAQRELMAAEIASRRDSLEAALPGGESTVAPGRGAEPPDSPTIVEPSPEDTAAVAPLTPQEEAQLAAAENQLEQVGSQLAALRKQAAKLGHQVDLDIQLAVTRALRGQPQEAIDDLDQIARTQPRTEIAAQARYEIGEIQRRLGNFDKARREYDESLKEKRNSLVADRAQRKSTAIVARSQAMERLKGAPKVLARWNAVQAGAATGDTTDAGKGRPGAEDSLGVRIALETEFQELANQQLRVAEIDLLDVDQPLAALHEFQQVLEEYPGSLQAPRAAFGIAWIYHHKLHDAERARQAYGVVARDHADTPQGREARAILDRWEQSGGGSEVKAPSSRP